MRKVQSANEPRPRSRQFARTQSHKIPRGGKCALFRDEHVHSTALASGGDGV